jgi:hypothetical protein
MSMLQITICNFHKLASFKLFSTAEQVPLFFKDNLEETVESFDWGQGCQIFLDTTYQNGKMYHNDHKIYQMEIKYTKMQYIK